MASRHNCNNPLTFIHRDANIARIGCLGDKSAFILSATGKPIAEKTGQRTSKCHNTADEDKIEKYRASVVCVIVWLQPLRPLPRTPFLLLLLSSQMARSIKMRDIIVKPTGRAAWSKASSRSVISATPGTRGGGGCCIRLCFTLCTLTAPTSTAVEARRGTSKLRAPPTQSTSRARSIGCCARV